MFNPAHPLGFVKKSRYLLRVYMLLWMKDLEREIALPISGGVDDRAAALSENACNLEGA
jgi:hypothetical protein